MSLREAAQAVLDRWDSPAWEWVKQGPTADLMADLRAALAEPERKPLTEEQVERAYLEIWSDSPDDFGPTAGDWVEAGIRYAERVHGIGEQK